MTLREFIIEAINEDAPFGDITSLCIAKDRYVEGVIVAKESGIFAGRLILDEFSELFNFKIESLGDGEEFKEGDTIANVKGAGYDVLMCERTLLNILSRLCGIATITREFVKNSSGVPIYDTRKTTPLMRFLEKYAVRVGGGYNHRMSLSEIVMIKDNHKRLAGSVSDAVNMVRKTLGEHAIIEVEVENLEELEEALTLNVDWVLLDNMDVETLRKAMSIAKGKVKVEISGGVNLDNLSEIVKLKPDRVSVGFITKGAKPIDMSLEIVKWW